MCGFLGWFRSPNTPWREDERALRRRALQMIVHRGPDDSAEVEGSDWWMGFQRLSILDLSDHGRQPMSFGGGRFTLTFNGEIYNFRALRQTLAGQGHHFETDGDTDRGDVHQNGAHQHRPRARAEQAIRRARAIAEDAANTQDGRSRAIEARGRAIR